MRFEEQFEPILEGYRLEWDNGVWRAVMDAFELCSDNNLPLPRWLHRAVLDELFYSYQHRPREEAGARTGSWHDLSKFKRLARYRIMRGLIEWQEQEIEIGAREGPVNKTEAAKEAERRMSETGHDARGSWRSILESYEAMANALKSGSE